MINKKWRSIMMVLLAMVILFSSGCAREDQQNKAQTAAPEQVVIAQQFGLAYAPLQIMEEQSLMEKYLPGTEIVWKQMGTGPVIRDAMVTGQVDIGFMGISPFLIGWDKGVEWKIAAASGSQPMGLVTNQKDIQSLADLNTEDRIATPAIASIQHILLSMAAEKQLGDASAFDSILLSLTHPDAAASLLSKKDVTAHFSSPPYLFDELSDKSIHQILSGEEAYGGEFTFIFGVAANKFHDTNPPAYAAFIAAFNEAVAFINNNPEQAAEMLAPLYGLSTEDMLRFLTWEGTNYTTTPMGIMAFADFMYQKGYIEKRPDKLSDIAFENIEAAVGKRYGGPSVMEELQWRNDDSSGK